MSYEDGNLKDEAFGNLETGLALAIAIAIPPKGRPTQEGVTVINSNFAHNRVAGEIDISTTTGRGC